jgi:hypothetical protein
VWNEDYWVPVFQASEVIALKVIDSKTNEFLGEIDLPCSRIFNTPGQPYDDWYVIRNGNVSPEGCYHGLTVQRIPKDSYILLNA